MPRWAPFTHDRKRPFKTFQKNTARPLTAPEGDNQEAWRERRVSLVYRPRLDERVLRDVYGAHTAAESKDEVEGGHEEDEHKGVQGGQDGGGVEGRGGEEEGCEECDEGGD